MNRVEQGAAVGAGASSASRSRVTVPVVIVVLVSLVLGAGWLLLQRAEAGVSTVSMNVDPKSVSVATSRATTFRATRRYVGTLQPWLSAKVGPQLASGFVDTVLVRPGASVKRGDVLATLDCRRASTAGRVIAMQARALAERQKAASREAARLDELLAGGFASPNEVERKQADVAANEAQVQALLAQAAGQSLEVDDCVLRAPFDGEVITRSADPGTFVRPGAEIVRVVDRSMIRLTGNVPEIDYPAVAPKTSVKIHVLSTGQALTGSVARRAPAADASTRTVHFEIDLPNADRELPVGTTAEVLVDVGEEMPATEIPLLAAKVRRDTATVFVVDGSVVEKKSVKVLGERGGSLFVSTELAGGANVVTQGRSLLASGDHVVARLETPLPPAKPSPVAPVERPHDAPKETTQ